MFNATTLLAELKANEQLLEARNMDEKLAKGLTQQATYKLSKMNGLSMSCMVCSNFWMLGHTWWQCNMNAPLLWQLKWSKLGQGPTIEASILGMMLASIKFYCHDIMWAMCKYEMYLFLYIDTLHNCKHEAPPLHLGPFWEVLGWQPWTWTSV